MQTKFKDGTVMVCGGCARDAELQIVGEKSNRLCKVGLAVGKRPDPEGGEKPATVWCNVVAWHGLASILSAARKGVPVLVIGHLESRDYEGKTYTDLVADNNNRKDEKQDQRHCFHAENMRSGNLQKFKLHACVLLFCFS